MAKPRGDPKAGKRAEIAVVALRVAERRHLVRVMIEGNPAMRTEALADILGWDRSTIRKDRVALGLKVAR